MKNIYCHQTIDADSDRNLAKNTNINAYCSSKLIIRLYAWNAYLLFLYAKICILVKIRFTFLKESIVQTFNMNGLFSYVLWTWKLINNNCSIIIKV